jgi:hypothetical protein
MAEKPGIQLVEDRHRSREFIEFLELLDAAYPAHTAIRLILDNHSAHICRKRLARLSTRAPLRIRLHSQARWLNPRRGLLFQLARSVLRHIRVSSKQEPRQFILKCCAGRRCGGGEKADWYAQFIDRGR